MSKAEIYKMIKFLHTHTDYKVVNGHELRRSTPKVKIKSVPQGPLFIHRLKSLVFYILVVLGESRFLMICRLVIVLFRGRSFLFFLEKLRVKRHLMFGCLR